MTTHTPEDQQLLDSMSEQEKLERTTPEAFKSRGVLENETQYFYISRNEMPYRNTKEYLILWEKDSSFYAFSMGYSASAIMGMLCLYSSTGYTISKNPPKKSSVKRSHWHIVKYNK